MTLLDTPTAPPTRPKGKAEEWDREKLAALALLLLADADRAALLWRSLAPRQYKRLLTAVPFASLADAPRPLPPLWFDADTQRYGAGNTAIPQQAIRQAVEGVRASAQGKAAASVSALYAGGMEIDEWQNALADTLKLLALAITAAAVGGIGRLTGADLTRASKGLLFHYKRLARFAKHIERGIITPSAAERRGELYPESVVTQTFEESRRESHIAVGYDEEQNVLRPADHCAGGTPELPDCPSLTAQGWVKIGTLPPPGSRVCRFRCRCYLEFRRSSDAE